MLPFLSHVWLFLSPLFRFGGSSRVKTRLHYFSVFVWLCVRWCMFFFAVKEDLFRKQFAWWSRDFSICCAFFFAFLSAIFSWYFDVQPFAFLASFLWCCFRRISCFCCLLLFSARLLALSFSLLLVFSIIFFQMLLLLLICCKIFPFCCCC